MGYQLPPVQDVLRLLDQQHPGANKAQSQAHARYSVSCVPYILQPAIFSLALFCRKDSNSCSVMREFVCRAPSTSLALEAMQDLGNGGWMETTTTEIKRGFQYSNWWLAWFNSLNHITSAATLWASAIKHTQTILHFWSPHFQLSYSPCERPFSCSSSPS